MLLVVISDTHGKHEELGELPPGDVLIHCGDFSSFGECEEVASFMKWFAAQPHKHKLLVPGNHEVGLCTKKTMMIGTEQFVKDRAANYDVIRGYRDQNVHLLVDRSIVIDGIKFHGTPWCGGSPSVMGRWGFYLYQDEHRRKQFSKIADDTDVLISHSPPYGILDSVKVGWMRKKEPLGCKVLLERVMEVQPAVHVFGHIHSGNGKKMGDVTGFFNCSNLDEDYNISYAPRVINIFKKATLVSSHTVPLIKKTPIKNTKDTEDAEDAEDTEFAKQYITTCMYCHSHIYDDSASFTTMAGSMCDKCYWNRFD